MVYNGYRNRDNFDIVPLSTQTNLQSNMISFISCLIATILSVCQVYKFGFNSIDLFCGGVLLLLLLRDRAGDDRCPSVPRPSSVRGLP